MEELTQRLKRKKQRRVEAAGKRRKQDGGGVAPRDDAAESDTDGTSHSLFPPPPERKATRRNPTPPLLRTHNTLTHTLYPHAARVASDDKVAVRQFVRGELVSLVDGRGTVVAHGTVQDGEPDAKGMLEGVKGMDEFLDNDFWLIVKVTGVTSKGATFRYDKGNVFTEEGQETEFDQLVDLFENKQPVLIWRQWVKPRVTGGNKSKTKPRPRPRPGPRSNHRARCSSHLKQR